MPQTRLAADVFGVVTISLVSLFALLGLLCIYRSIYFWLRIQRGDFVQLGYFNGPWITRVALILVAIWSGVGEIVRLSFLKGEGRLLTSLIWQRNVCKFYILSNLGFAEPCLFLTLVFLLHASMQKRESGTLSQWWNRRTIGYILLFCLPIFVMQVALIFIGPNLNEQKSNGRTMMSKYFTSTSSLIRDSSSVCTYPLFGTIFLGLFYALLISYLAYIGTRMLSLVINKGLRRKVYWLMSSVIFFLPLRILLLGFSVLPQPGNFAHEFIVFLAFAMLLCCTTVGICMLVYCPVVDSLALRDVSFIEMGGVPYDDYCSEGGSLVANRSHLDIGRSSDASTKRGSISFRTMIRDEPSAPDGHEESSFTSFGALHAASPSGSPLVPGRIMLPLGEVPRY